MKPVRLLVAACAAALLSGCYSFTINMDALNGQPAPNGRTTPLHLETWAHHYVFGLITPSDPELVPMIVQAVRAQGGRGVKNLRITHQLSFLNALVGGVTLSLYAPTTVVIDGEIVN